MPMDEKIINELELLKQKQEKLSAAVSGILKELAALKAMQTNSVMQQKSIAPDEKKPGIAFDKAETAEPYNGFAGSEKQQEDLQQEDNEIKKLVSENNVSTNRASSEKKSSEEAIEHLTKQVMFLEEKLNALEKRLREPDELI